MCGQCTTDDKFRAHFWIRKFLEYKLSLAVKLARNSPFRFEFNKTLISWGVVRTNWIVDIVFVSWLILDWLDKQGTLLTLLNKLKRSPDSLSHLFINWLQPSHMNNSSKYIANNCTSLCWEEICTQSGQDFFLVFNFVQMLATSHIEFKSPSSNNREHSAKSWNCTKPFLGDLLLHPPHITSTLWSFNFLLFTLWQTNAYHNHQIFVWPDTLCNLRSFPT